MPKPSKRVTKPKAPKIPKTNNVKSKIGKPPRSGNTPIKLKNKHVKPENIGISARRREKLRAEGKLPPPKTSHPGRWKPGERVNNVTYATVLKKDRINTIIDELMTIPLDDLEDTPTNSARIEWARKLLMLANEGNLKAINMMLDRWKGPVTQFVVQQSADEDKFDPTAPLEIRVVSASKRNPPKAPPPPPPKRR